MKVSPRYERHRFYPSELQQDECEVLGWALKKRYLSRWFDRTMVKTSEKLPVF